MTEKDIFKHFSRVASLGMLVIEHVSETQFQILQLLVLYTLARAAQLVQEGIFQLRNFFEDLHKMMQATFVFSKYE